MVVLKWLHQFLVGSRPEVVSQAGGQQSIKETDKKHKGVSVDLANATLVDHAESLDDLINIGSPAIMRKRLKKRVKKKVQRVIADEYSDPDIVEEVTERIADVAEADPFYKRLFGQDSET